MTKGSLQRIISLLWPIPVSRSEGNFGMLEVRWEGGRKVLNSAHGNQSFGSLHRVWQQAFEHIELRAMPPANVLLLGLGAGSVPTILRKEMGCNAPITAVEIDPKMTHIGRSEFDLGELAGLTIIEGDATVRIHALPDRYALVVVDLFEDLDLARGADTMGFAHALRERCDEILLFNTVGYHAESKQRCDRVRENLTRCFHTVDELVLEDVNRVFIAR